MNVEEAEAVAAQLLRDSSSPGGHEVAIDRRYIRERAWCFVFIWDSVEFLTTGDFLASVMGRPIVVPKDGGEPILLGTYKPLDDLLDDYEREHGIPPSVQHERSLLS
ncbi:MAG: hypothetical protein GEV10_23655 [Streptosporangiales bacterium]|nr:hypothetical protein [Streptosporangiales bacterium]